MNFTEKHKRQFVEISENTGKCGDKLSRVRYSFNFLFGRFPHFNSKTPAVRNEIVGADTVTVVDEEKNEVVNGEEAAAPSEWAENGGAEKYTYEEVFGISDQLPSDVFPELRDPIYRVLKAQWPQFREQANELHMSPTLESIRQLFAKLR